MANSTTITVLGVSLFVGLPPNAPAQSLEAEQRAWEATRPRSYQFEYRKSCFCWGAGAWWRIAVRDDSIISILLVDSTGARSGLDRVLADEHPTIRRLFGDRGCCRGGCATAGRSQVRRALAVSRRSQSFSRYDMVRSRVRSLDSQHQAGKIV